MLLQSPLQILFRIVPALRLAVFLSTRSYRVPALGLPDFPQGSSIGLTRFPTTKSLIQGASIELTRFFSSWISRVLGLTLASLIYGLSIELTRFSPLGFLELWI